MSMFSFIEAFANKQAHIMRGTKCEIKTLLRNDETKYLGEKISFLNLNFLHI